jgi:hypothetical protein
MNKRISNFFEKHSACISILALVLSIVSLLISLPRCRNLGFDYLGFIVAVLSIIAAFAIGFQIWSAISVESKIQKSEEKLRQIIYSNIEESKNEIHQNIDNFKDSQNQLLAYLTMVSNARISLYSKDYEDAFICSVNALECASKLDNSEELIKLIKPQILSLAKSRGFTISEEYKIEIAKILLSVSDKELNEIAFSINNSRSSE